MKLPEGINPQWWCWQQLEGVDPKRENALMEFLGWNNQMLSEWSKTKGLKGRQDHYSDRDIAEYRQWLLRKVEEKEGKGK